MIGTTPGMRASLDVTAPASSLQDSVQQTQDVNQQRQQHLAQQEQQQSHQQAQVRTMSLG